MVEACGGRGWEGAGEGVAVKALGTGHARESWRRMGVRRERAMEFEELGMESLGVGRIGGGAEEGW